MKLARRKLMAKRKGKAKRTARRPAKGTTRRKRAVTRPAARSIDTVFKGLTLAAQPPIDASPANLDATFLTKLNAALAQLSSDGRPFRLVEGFRTTIRQQWLFGSGRPTAVPFGRPGPILTNADGVKALSKHQGAGTPGSGRAADCYPTKNGKVFIPPSSDPVWTAYASEVTKQGLVAGHNFKKLKDSPHCELA
jgi:hypothetical protein